MFDRLPAVRHAAGGPLADASIAEFALHRPGCVIAVEVAVDQRRQAEVGKGEADFRRERLPSVAAALIGGCDPDSAAGRPGLPIDLVEADPADQPSLGLQFDGKFIGWWPGACI